MVAKQQSQASMNPDSFQEGGLLDNVDVTWKECQFEMWDYNGTQPVAVPALRVTMDVEDGEEATQYFSAGDAKNWEPSKDGRTLVGIGSAAGINKSSNLAILINSMIAAGFPKDKIGEDCEVFEGLKCHMVRVAAPKRAGLSARAPRADGRVFEATNLVVDKIIKLPWEKGAGKAAASKSSSKKEEKESAADDAVVDKARETVMEILSQKENKKGLDKKKLASQVFAALKEDPDRNDIVKMVYDDEFLAGGMWTYENGVVGG